MSTYVSVSLMLPIEIESIEKIVEWRYNERRTADQSEFAIGKFSLITHV